MAKSDYEAVDHKPNLLRHKDPKNGSYACRIMIGGKTIWRALKTKDQAIALRLIEKIKTNSVLKTSTAESVGDIVDRYIAGRNEKNDKYTRDKFVKFYEPGLKQKIRNAKYSEIQAMLAKLLNSYRSENDPFSGANTHNKMRDWIIGVFDVAVADNILSVSPINKLNLKKVRIVKKKRFIPTLSEFEQIMNEIRFNPEASDFIEFEAYAALGQAEVRALKWSDVDFENNRIAVVRRKTSKRFTIPIHHGLMPILERRLKNKKSDNDLIFTLLNPKRTLENACFRLWGQKSKFSQRDLRCMRINWWYNTCGISVKQIALWQGHSDGGIEIMKVYTEIFSTDTEKLEESALERIKKITG